MDKRWLDKRLFHQLSQDFEQVYIVPGNHEFYHASFPIKKVMPSFEYEVTSNIHYLNNRVIHIDNVKLVFTTLWSKIFRSQFIEERISDFHHCVYDERAWVKYKAFHHNKCHKESLIFLNNELSTPHDGPTVVVSHYVPFEASYCDYNFESDLSEFFHVDLSVELDNWHVNHWIYGHNHYNQESFQIGKTWFHTNQLGYVSRGELSTSFKTYASISV